MQLGIGTYTYSWAVAANAVNELDLIEKAKQSDVHVLQIGDNLPLHLFSRARLQQFMNALKENNIRLEIGARKLTAENLANYIRLAAEMNVGILRFVIDYTDYEPSLHEIIDIIRVNENALKENNTVLAIENHDRMKAAAFAEIIERLNSEYIGICLDTTNSLGAGESIETIIDTLAPYTVNLHIKDFGIARLPHKQGFIIDGRVAGEGMLNVDELLKKLKPYNRCHTCILEQWVPPEKDAQATIIKEQQWAEKSMKFLKRLTYFDSAGHHV